MCSHCCVKWKQLKKCFSFTSWKYIKRTFFPLFRLFIYISCVHVFLTLGCYRPLARDVKAPVRTRLHHFGSQIAGVKRRASLPPNFVMSIFCCVHSTVALWSLPFMLLARQNQGLLGLPQIRTEVLCLFLTKSAPPPPAPPHKRSAEKPGR